MKRQIKDLVAMGDVQTLSELMSEQDDWMDQLDAAEALTTLGDPRGLEFLLNAEHSDEDDIRKVAKEILASPEVARRREEFEAEEKRELQKKVEIAKKDLAKGHKVFRYKMVYFSSGDFLSEDPLSEGYEIPALTELGLEGWEIVNILARRRQLLTTTVDDAFSGAYFLLKKELQADQASELDELA